MFLRKNKEIKAAQVRVIGPAGVQRGVMSIRDALLLATSFDMDLVEICPNATPLIVRVIDWDKAWRDKRKN